MLRGDLVYWLGWLGVIVVNLGAIYLAWWALFHDKSRGKRRCPRCWYDMSYSPGMTCAECGYVGENEKVFQRTRRRYKLAALAIFVCVALAMFVNDRANTGGWQSVMPTRVLLAMTPLYQDDRNETFGALMRRLNGNEFTDGDWNALLSRVVKGDWRAEPGTIDWVEKYGDMAAFIRQRFVMSRTDGTLTPQELRLLEIEPLLTLDSRSTWPTGARPRVRMQMRDWWPAGTQTRLTITQRGGDAEAKPVTVYHNGQRQPWAGFTFDGPVIEEGPHTLTFDVEIAQRLDDALGAVAADAGSTEAAAALNEWSVVSARTVKLDVRGRGGLDDALEPFADDDGALRRAIGSVFGAGVVRWTDGPSRVRNYCHTPRTFRPEFNNIAVGVSVEVLFEGEPARRLEIWWLAGQVQGDHNVGWEAVMEDDPVLTEVAPDDDRWSLRITGKRELALRAGDAKYFWDGQIEMPLRVDLRQRSAPPTAWWTDDPADLEGDS